MDSEVLGGSSMLVSEEEGVHFLGVKTQMQNTLIEKTAQSISKSDLTLFYVGDSPK